jgi:5-methylcytosine-specific restriction endonuclease McrA
MDFDKALDSEKKDRVSSWEWELKRMKVFARDDNACRSCGSKESLEVDHIIPVALGGYEDLDNLQTLCYDCHKKKTVQDNEKVRRVKKTRKYKKKIRTGFET